jgi:hypothetical protein
MHRLQLNIWLNTVYTLQAASLETTGQLLHFRISSSSTSSNEQVHKLQEQFLKLEAYRRFLTGTGRALKTTPPAHLTHIKCLIVVGTAPKR